MGPPLRPSTFEGYRLDVRRVCERIGGRRLQSLTPAMLNRLYGELGERLAPRTVRGVLHLLRQALADAVAWQRLPRNPADRAKPPSLAAGVHPKVLQERLGHATIAITLDTYSHAIPAMQEDAAAKIAALLER